MDFLSARFNELNAEEGRAVFGIREDDTVAGWAPDTMFSPNIDIQPAPPQDPNRPHNSVWNVSKSFGSDWSSFIADRSYSEGVIYWTIEVLNYDLVMVGLCSPSNLGDISIANLDTYIGNSSSSLLGLSGISVYAQPGSIDLFASNKCRRVLDVGTTVRNGARYGYLLDLVHGEFHYFHFNAGNTTNVPNQSFLVSKLKRGRSYYPVMSLCRTAGRYRLDTAAAPPREVVPFFQQVTNRMDLLVRLRREIEVLKEINAEGEDKTQLRMLIQLRNKMQRSLGVVI